MSKSKLLKKLVSQTAIYGLSSIVGRLLNYLLVPIYTRVFTATQYGAVTELYSYIGFLMVLYTYGMETAYFRYVKESEHPSETVYSTAFWSLAGSTALLTAVLLLLSPTLSVSLGYANHTNYLVYILLILGFDTLTALPFAKLRYDEHPKRFAFVRIANIVVSIGLNLFFLVACPILSPKTALVSSWYNPSFGIGYIFISNLTASAITLALLLPELKQLKWNIDTPLLKKMLLYGLPLIVVGLAGSINEMLDRVILKYLLPYDSATNMAQLGIYGACYKLSILMTLFTQAFKMGAEPFFFAQAKEKNAPQTYAYITRYFTIVGLFIFLGVMLFLPIIKHFIGTNYHQGLAIVPILLLANLCLGIYYNVAIWYKLTNKTALGATISVFGAFVTIVLNLIWIPTMGYIGSAWATLACYAAMMIVSYIWGQQHYKIPYPIVAMAAYLLLALFLWQLDVQWLSATTHKIPMLNYILKIMLLVVYLNVVLIVERKPKQNQA